MDCGQTSRSASNFQGQKVCNILFLCSEWKYSKGGLPTFNREFAVNLAKSSSDTIKVHCYVSQSDELDREDARKHGVNLITAQSVPGSADSLDWLKIPPPELPHPDIVVGHGRKFGTPAYFIVKTTKCKWVHFVHVFCEDLGKYKVTESSVVDPIEENEKKHKSEIELCKAANAVVAVGSRLQHKYSASLPTIKVEIVTPGILEKFASESTQLQPNLVKKKFKVFMFGRATFEDLTLKGYDIVANAIGSLGKKFPKKFELTFVGSPVGEHRKIEQWFLDNTCIQRNQLTIRGYCNVQVELKMMFCESDLVAMPSRTEGFGLVSLEAISAGVPVLVTDESGIAEALEKVEGGKSVIVESENAEEWAQRIEQLSSQTPAERGDNAMQLRDSYRKTYSWSTECEKFKRVIQDLMGESRVAYSPNAPLNARVNVQSQVHSDDQHKPTEKEPSVDETELRAELLLKDQKCKVPSSGDVDNVTKAKSESSQQTSEPDPDSAPLSGRVNVQSGKTADDQHNTTEQEPSSVEEIKLGAELLSNNQKRKAPSSSNVENVKKAKSDQASEADPDSGWVLQGDSAWSIVKGSVVDHFTHSTPPVLTETCGEKESALVENKGWNSLHSAAEGGNVAIIETMLSCGLDIDSRGNDGTTPLMVAAAAGKELAVNFLLNKGADPSLRNNMGRNLLHAATEGGNTSIVKIVLSYGIDIDSRDDQFLSTPLMIAAMRNHTEVVEYLLEKGADSYLKTSDAGRNVLFIAAQYGSVATIECLLTHGFSPDSRDYKGFTVLMCAAACGKTEAVDCLLENGADPLLKDKNDWSLLHFAAQSGNIAIIETMLSKGLKIDSRGSCLGLTPLMVSIKNNKLEATNYLLERGADPSLKSSIGMTVLGIAAVCGSVAIIKMLLSRGFSLDSRDVEGDTPLMYAATSGNIEAVDYLLAKGADPLLKGQCGLSLLHFASQSGNITIIKTMLSKGLSIDSGDYLNRTPLTMSIINERLEATKYLLDSGADLSIQATGGQNSLHVAAAKGSIAMIDLLLSHGLDIESKDGEGRTPLMIAAVAGNNHTVEYLVKRGASVS